MQFQPWIPCNTPHLTQCTTMSHNIIGEGDVVALVSSGGGLQYFFAPAVHGVPFLQNTMYDPNVNYVNWNKNKPLWFVRSMCNPYQFQTYPTLAEGIPIPNPFNVENNQPIQQFELKFHNDCWTSTTDLHYFYPSLRQYNWFPSLITKGSAAVQVEMPSLNNNVCHYEIVCNCAVKKNKKNCNCRDTTSVMSIDEVVARCAQKKLDTKKFSSNVVCKCNKFDAVEKSVTTYAERGCGLSMAEETQTLKTSEKKNTKKSKTKRRKGTKQIEIETDETSSYSCQSCNCNSETE